MRPCLFVVACVAAASAVLGAGCNNVPVANLEKSFSVLVDQSSGTGDPVQIDFLWVVDNSTSMCEEQTALSASFGAFTKVFNEDFKLDLDPRVAVVTTDMLCSEQQLAGAGAQVIATRGGFNGRPAGSYPPACQAKVIKQCSTDDDCEALDCSSLGVCAGSCGDDDDCLYGKCEGGQCPRGTWSCRETQSASCIVNPNGTLNTSCVRGCFDDAECQAVYGDDRFICQKTSGNQNDWGCMLPPETSVCPDEDGDGKLDAVPAVLNKSNLDLFPCLATVGANQLKCNQYEQGLASALAALDKSGPNSGFISCTAEQEAKEECVRFLRPDAYLVIVFVSDEDDCSAAMSIPEADHDICALPETQAEGSALIPVWHYVNHFKSLKSDPSRVIVAAIAGEAVVPAGGGTTPPPGIFIDDDGTTHQGELLLQQMDPCEVSADPTEQEAVDYVDCIHDWYDASKGNPYVCYHTTTICRSASGQADWGRRYWELADRFGSNGIFVNICSDEGIEPALVTIAQKIVTIVKKVCLPKPVLDPASLVVKKTLVDPATDEPVLDPATGEPQLVTLAGDDYVLQSNGGDDCKVNGETRPAIVFVTPPAGGETVVVTYQGDPLLGE